MMRVPQFGRIFMKNGPQTSQQIFWWILYDDISWNMLGVSCERCCVVFLGAIKQTIGTFAGRDLPRRLGNAIVETQQNARDEITKRERAARHG